ncbi:MAG TPA: hypothetical protein VNJ03_09465 [Vicinamibacterales bacterium]|nr:hypothetical protein [Vicinamibacterales bacterium]
MNPDRITLSLEAADLARALHRHHDFRVQRRLGPMDRRMSGDEHARGTVGLALAVRTSGDDHRRDRIVELSVQRFRLDRLMRIVETGERRTWLEEAPTPISAVSGRDVDLVDGDLIGRAISDGEATAILLDVDFVVAHGASATRPFVERRLPLAAGRPWACSLDDMDWRARGFLGGSLLELMAPMGWFHEERRAEADVTALLHLLDHCPSDETTVAGLMVDRAGRASWTVEVADAPESAEDVLRARGYVPDILRRIWSASVCDEDVADEVRWASIMLYGDRREPDVRRITWCERYA